MRRIIIALVALIGFAGFAEAHPRHHHHHHHRHFGYSHHHHHFHFRGYHRHHWGFRGHHRHHRYASWAEPQAEIAAAPAAVAQPWFFGTPAQAYSAYPQTRRQAFRGQPFRAAERQRFVRPRASLSGSGGGSIVSASWYGGSERLSSRTASGERFNRGGLTAAHRTLPFGTRVSVTNPQTGASVVVRINDRGPFVRGRSLDLARGAAQAIGLRSTGAVRMVVLN
jgi:rare lipoprotein A